MKQGRSSGSGALTAQIEQRSNLTRGQFLIWTGQQISPELPIYNMGWCFGIGVEVDPETFEHAFSSLADDCDILRMVFNLDGEVPQFAIGTTPSGSHETVKTSSEGRDACVQELIQKPFDLALETFRSVLLHIDGDRWEWILIQHHITTDAASGEILLRQLSDRYEKLSRGGEESLALPPSYSAWATGAGRQSNPDDAAFWATKTGGMPVLSTPYGLDGSTRSAKTEKLVVQLGAVRMAKLQALLVNDDFAALTMPQAQFNFLATAVSGWLGRVNNADTTVIGVTTHGRTTFEARETAGLFMATLPLQVDIEPGTTVLALHEQVSSNAMELMMHASAGASTSASHATFNVILNYVRTTFGSFAGAPVKVEWLDHGHFDPAHALWVDVVGFSGEQELFLNLRFNDGIFPKYLRKRAAAQILCMIDAMLADPNTVVQNIALADDGDQSLSLVWADPFTTNNRPTDVLAALERHCQDDPSRLAVSGDGKSISRAELADRSNAVAQFLVSEGVGAGNRVGVFLTRGIDLVVTILGVLKSGAAYVPLDPLQPLGRLKAIAGEAGLATVVTEARLAARWPEAGSIVIVEDITQFSGETLPVQNDANADAYVIFTSGSTGKPKGVRVGRAALSRYADWAARTYSADGPAEWALHSAIGFDLTVTSIFAPLVSGGSIRAYRETLDSPDLSILKVFSDDLVGVVKLTPAHLALALRNGTPTERIQTLILGGENLDAGLAQNAIDTFGSHLSIFNEYGPTEATVGCMVHRFDPKADAGNSVPIGRSAGDTAIYVLDQGFNPVPDYVKGEIFVSGLDRLASGYLAREDETALKFVTNPFVPGAKMYRTGDLAHVDQHGIIHYHGRADDQIKIGSARVELGEIHNAVISHPAIDDCAILYGKEPSDVLQRCDDCGLGTDHPDSEIDDTGKCRLCRDFETYREKANDYFRSMDDLKAIIDEASDDKAGDYECLMLLSGGKDSTYALGQLLELTPRVLAVTLDNGFVSQGAKENVERVCKTLNVDHRYISTPHMNEIFADSLDRHANVCNGCFKTIYTLGMQLAREEGIGLIVTGLSRGQLFETRLAPELFGEDAVTSEQIDLNITEARRSYHRVPDAAAQLLNGRFFDDDTVFEEIRFVDFYRYCDVTVDDIFAYLDKKVPWLRPTDTGRSSNCLINDLGIYIHKRRRGYHNYALPYSWDVRTGHKTREAALAELDDDLDEGRMRDQMRQIDYQEDQRHGSTQMGLQCYVVSKSALDLEDLRDYLGSQLPRNMIPTTIILVPDIPLTPNGKVDRTALQAIGSKSKRAPIGAIRRPVNGKEELLLEIWRNVLDRDDFGTSDNFFEIGGDSVHAISVASRALRAGLAVSALSILTKQTVSAVVTDLAGEHQAAKPAPTRRAALDKKSLAHLGTLFGKRPDG